MSIGKALDWCSRELQNPEHQKTIRSHIVSPILRQVFQEVYPYMVLIFAVLGVIAIMIFVMFILTMLSFCRRPYATAIPISPT